MIPPTPTRETIHNERVLVTRLRAKERAAVTVEDVEGEWARRVNMPAWALLSSVHQKARAEAGELLADAWGCRGARRERLTLQRGAGDQLSLSEVQGRTG